MKTAALSAALAICLAMPAAAKPIDQLTSAQAQTVATWCAGGGFLAAAGAATTAAGPVGVALFIGCYIIAGDIYSEQVTPTPLPSDER